MNSVERFHAVMNFQPADRLPVLEWAPWWNLTLERWYNEGLDRALTDKVALDEHFGLDPFRGIRVAARGPTCPPPPYHGGPIMAAPTFEEYEKLKPHLFPTPGFNVELMTASVERRRRQGDLLIWVAIDGFFWFPRTILGIENHLYALCDAPDLLLQMNTDLLAHHQRVLDRMLDIGAPDLLTFAEDMSYNHGPMLSRAHFDRIVAPFYQPVLDRLAGQRCVPMIDSDGDVHELVKWTTAAGVNGVLPLERQAGVDVAKLRDDHPTLRLLGAFDKMVIKDGPEAVERELRRLLPTMRRGGYVPGVDHQTPPEVPLAIYREHVKLLRKYCEIATRS